MFPYDIMELYNLYTIYDINETFIFTNKFLCQILLYGDVWFLDNITRTLEQPIFSYRRDKRINITKK